MIDFDFNSVRIPYFYHRYNCGFDNKNGCTERSIEIALAKYWLELTNPDPLIEVGCVLPHYNVYDQHYVVDLYEDHPAVTDKRCASKVSYACENVLSISTLEHIKTTDNREVLQRIIDVSRSCFLTIPLGLSENHPGFQLQSYIFENYENFDAKVHMINRHYNLRYWEIVPIAEEFVQSYGKNDGLHGNANTILAIIKT